MLLSAMSASTFMPAGALCLRFDDDLVTGINGGHAGIALDHAFAGGHLGGFVVSAVALADRAFAALPVFGVVSQPCAELRRIGLQAGDALGFSGLKIGFVGTLICFTMPFKHHLGSSFKLSCLALEIGTGAALCLGGVARQFHAINGEHLPTDQTLLVADEEYLGEDAGDVVAQR